ncbi:hypothetical protein AVDCRST_MAG94-232 [uncultured Leptolyngbya sp.]|uniref:Uncharacterized protein n=1 Tax=uncultured Leptolyngbya sp. TaxID=332963 RepID=A0A6J4K8L9_9CYAN|nr:hypothetical protein AVDCRST_MAG94-232 [uncultured Leptolyngbya sp.]
MPDWAYFAFALGSEFRGKQGQIAPPSPLKFIMGEGQAPHQALFNILNPNLYRVSQDLNEVERIACVWLESAPGWPTQDYIFKVVGALLWDILAVSAVG